MGRGIHVGAVVSTHGEGGKVVKIPALHGTKYLSPRRGIPGIYRAGKEFLGNVVKLHVVFPLQIAFGWGKDFAVF
jgi:hypothetical protein